MRLIKFGYSITSYINHSHSINYQFLQIIDEHQNIVANKINQNVYIIYSMFIMNFYPSTIIPVKKKAFRELFILFKKEISLK